MKIVPNKGTTVTRLNREIVDELIYERTAVEARVLRDFSPKCTPEQRALIRRRADAYAALARAEEIDYNKLYEADRLLHETWFAAMGKMYLWRTLQNAHADYSRFRVLAENFGKILVCTVLVTAEVKQGVTVSDYAFPIVFEQAF